MLLKAISVDVGYVVERLDQSLCKSDEVMQAIVKTAVVVKRAVHSFSVENEVRPTPRHMLCHRPSSQDRMPQEEYGSANNAGGLITDQPQHPSCKHLSSAPHPLNHMLCVINETNPAVFMVELA